MTINRWLIIILSILIIGLITSCSCQMRTMEGMSVNSNDAKKKYNDSDTLTNARSYFVTVATDITATANEKRVAAEQYKIKSNKYGKNDKKEDDFANSAYNFYKDRILKNAKAYRDTAKVAPNVSDAVRFVASYAYYIRLSRISADYNAVLKECYDLIDKSNYPLRKFIIARDYYLYGTGTKGIGAAKKYRDTSFAEGSGASNIQKYDAAKAYYDETIKNGLNNTQTNDAAVGIYTVAQSNSQKYDAATKMYNSATTSQKYDAATKMYNSATTSQKYDAANKMYNSAILDKDKYISAKAVYTTSLQRDSKREKYEAANNLLTYIDKTGNNLNTHFHTDVAKIKYYNSPDDNTKFNAVKEWYNIALLSGSHKTDSAKAYYEISLKSQISCKNKCLAAKAYQNNSNALTDYHIYKTMMGENCERDVSSCPLPTQTDGFQNREPMTQCQQNTQSTSFTVARDAYNAYDTTPNQKYTKLSTMDLYFTSANEPNSGLNTNDKMNVAKTRLEYMLTLTDVEPPKKLAAARDYYNASLKLDCGNDISYNQYSAIKTYYEIVKDMNEVSKSDLSKKYYDATVRANRPNAEQYTVAKIWFANSQTPDSAKEVVRTSKLENSGTDDYQQQTDLITYRNILKDNGILGKSDMQELWPAIYDSMKKTNQSSEFQFAEADLAYNKLKKEGFVFTTNCDAAKSDPILNSACVGYKNATTAEQKLEYAQNWSDINYQTDIVDRRKELDNELSKLNENTEVKIHKLDLDTTIMMNIAATVLASSLIVFSITKL